MSEPLWNYRKIRDAVDGVMFDIKHADTIISVVRATQAEELLEALRDEYEARIAELEQEQIALWHTINTQATYAEELEAKLAERWEPLPDGEYRSVADNWGPFSVFGNGVADAYPVIRQNDNLVLLNTGDAICRRVTKGE